jgi:hypothetical protein
MISAATVLLSLTLVAVGEDVSVWVSYSKDYDTLWSNRSLADREIDAIAQQHIGTVFLTMSAKAPGLKQLSNRRDPFTVNVQYALNRLAAHHIAACAAILSDNFTGSPGQMARYTVVDNLVDFNRAAGPGDAHFVCVSTDLEMTSASRALRIYDLWKAFHASLRKRITERGGDIRVVAWMQGPDYLMSHLPPVDRQALMARERITVDPADTSLYHGALRYFMTTSAGPTVDAVIPMWYFTPAEAYERHVDHNLRELQDLKRPTLQLIAGIMVRNQRAGLCCPGCVDGRGDYDRRIEYDQRDRAHTPAFTGTAVFLWPIPSQWTCPSRTQ